MSDTEVRGTALPGNPQRWPWVAAFLVVAVLLAVVAALLTRREMAESRQRALRDLAAVAAMKTGQLVIWRGERLNDARLLTMAGSPLFEVEVRPALAAGASPQTFERLSRRLGQIRARLGYQAVLMVSPAGTLLAGAGQQPSALEPALQDLVQRAAASEDARFGELTADAADGASIDVAAGYRDADGELMAVLVLRSAGHSHLFPLLRAWPTGSPTAETLLVAREGEELVFLGPLRHASAQPIARRRPLATQDVVGARAALGQAGVVAGRDYRGEEVLADLRAVPGSPWFMVAKIDAAEVVAEARQRSVGGLLLAGGGIVTAALLLLALAAVQRRNAWRARYQVERSEREALEEYRATLLGIGDGVLSCDAQGRVRRLNPVAEALTGWTEGEAQGRPVREVFRIVDEDGGAELESPVERVLREGRAVGLNDHTLLVARDGRARPIADSGAPVQREDGTLAGAVLVFRDRSTERAAIKALRASESRQRRLFEGSADALLLLDMDRQRFVDCNDAAVMLLGLDHRDEVLDTHPAELSPPRQDDGRDSGAKATEMIETARREGFHRFEWTHSSRMRAPFPVDVLLTPITEGPPALALVTWRDLGEVKRAAREREAAAAELAERNDELARFNRAAVGRELRMVELKREADALRRRLGEPAVYAAQADAGPDGGPA